jgi:hypothetical protein
MSGDEVCLLLGCYSPIILRPAASRKFQVVGEAYVHGLEDAKGILGPLPAGWKVVIMGDVRGRPLPRYLDLRSYQVTAEDPRLGGLPLGWERVEHERTPNDPAFFEMFRNNGIGEMSNSDPQLTPESLKSRNIPLVTFQLV